MSHDDIYQKITHSYVCFLQSKINKVYGIFTVLAVLVSVILCVVEGTKSHRKPTDFLLLANIVCE